MQPLVEAEVSNLSFDLAATVRGITPGDVVLIDGSGNGSGSYPAVVTGYSEATWYSVNGGPATPTFPLPVPASTPASTAASTPPPPVVVPFPASRFLQLSMPPSAVSALMAVVVPFVRFRPVRGRPGRDSFEAVLRPEVTTAGQPVRDLTTAEEVSGTTGLFLEGSTDIQLIDEGRLTPVPPQILRYVFTDVGTLIPVPVASLAGLPATATIPAGFQPPATAAAAFVEDSIGAGAAVTVTAASPPGHPRRAGRRRDGHQPRAGAPAAAALGPGRGVPWR